MEILTQKTEKKQSQIPISFDVVSEKTWFIMQDYIKNSGYIQREIAFAKSRSTGLDHEDFESEVLVLCMETAIKCFKFQHECLNTENCVNCTIFEFRLKDSLSNYLRQETRDMPIRYASKDLSIYENTVIASVDPDIDMIFEDKQEDPFEKVDGLLEKFSKILNIKERKILEMYLKGYQPKVIAVQCKYKSVQAVYITLKRIINKIKMHLDEQ